MYQFSLNHFDYDCTFPKKGMAYVRELHEEVYTMNWFLNDAILLGRILVIGVLIYLYLILTLRAFGKRTLSKMNAFDFIITLAIGSTFSTIIINKSISLIEGMVALTLLVFLQYVATFSMTRSRSMQKILRSQPALLYYGNQFIEETMQKERIIHEEINQFVRLQGHSDYSDIQAVILEPDGSLSILTSQGELITG